MDEVAVARLSLSYTSIARAGDQGTDACLATQSVEHRLRGAGARILGCHLIQHFQRALAALIVYGLQSAGDLLLVGATNLCEDRPGARGP